MSKYYQKHEGNLFAGHIAEAQDINQIQQNTADAITNAIDDVYGGEGCILGGAEDAFLLTPAETMNGRYVDQYNPVATEEEKYVSIRQTTYRQGIPITKTSIYSVIIKLRNKSKKTPITVTCELQDEEEKLIKNCVAKIVVPPETEGDEYEVIFDLDYYPTVLNKESSEVVNNSNAINPLTDSSAPAEGEELVTDDETNEDSTESVVNSAGASQVYFVIHALNKVQFDIYANDGEYVWNDEDPTFGVLMNTQSKYGQYLQSNNGSGYVTPDTPGDLYFKEIYSNSPTYKCNAGAQAIVGGEKVTLSDSHVVVNGGSAWGTIKSYIYMDQSGNLKSINSDPYTGDEPETMPPIGEPHLHIADIITDPDDETGPIIIQDDTNQTTRLRDHHERLRRLENIVNWTQDLALPHRLKYTWTGEDWIDTKNSVIYDADQEAPEHIAKLDQYKKSGYSVVTDANGEYVVKTTNAVGMGASINFLDPKMGTVESGARNIIRSAQTSSYINKKDKTDETRLGVIAAMKNIEIDIKTGSVTLESNNPNFSIASTDKEAKLTEFYPWDDTKENREIISGITGKVTTVEKMRKQVQKQQDKKNKEENAGNYSLVRQQVPPKVRSYTVVSGKNDKNDKQSQYPGMTLYVEKSLHLKKLTIPITKFKNCSGVKFMLWRRQDKNNKKNSVDQLQKRIDVSPKFSLKNAKKKNGYQIMEDGFTWDFGSKGCTLKKGQYVIIAVPIVSSGKGTMYVETYRPAKARDFCIKYHGAANASHFEKMTSYPEVWYNSAKAVGYELEYKTSGYLTSATVTWKDTSEPIRAVRPKLNMTTPAGTRVVVEVKTGGSKWTELKLNEYNTVEGGGKTFAWRLKLYGTKSATPVIKYSKKKKYALRLDILRGNPRMGDTGDALALDNNLCFTSKPFSGDKILREYIGDEYLGSQVPKFSNFEFARIWGEGDDEKKLSIDLAGSDVTKKAGSNYIPIYSMYYVDLSLDDFDSGSVDYSNYDPNMEDDEHNLRLKLDTEYSYNDSDIVFFNIADLQPTIDTLAIDDKPTSINISKVTSSTKNQIIGKAVFPNTINLAKYGGIRVGMKINGEDGGSLKGVALYISSSETGDNIPSNLDNEPTDLVDANINTPEDQLPDLNASQEDVVQAYGGKIIKRYEKRNGIAGYVYYKSVWDQSTQKWNWELLHNIKSYNIYELKDRQNSNGDITVNAADKDTTKYFEIEGDENDINLQYAKEIGIILLNDEEKFSMEKINDITIEEIKAFENDYYKFFDPSIGDAFTIKADAVEHKSYKNKDLQASGITDKATTPATNQVSILHQSTSASQSQVLAVFDGTSKLSKGFNHIGIKFVADCPIVKNMFELHLRKKNDDGSIETLDTIRIPTINYAFYPGTAHSNINLYQIFKKIDTTERIDEIALVSTTKTKSFGEKIKKQFTVGGQNGATSISPGADGRESISLFFGDIVLYKARTIPMMHQHMRMKIYLDNMSKISRELVEIRKLGVVAEYK